MTLVEQLAAFVTQSSFDDLSKAAVAQLKIRVLDALGCALGALDGEPIQLIRAQISDFGGAEHCTLIGDGKTAPDRAAFYNGALVRYLDFNDAYLAKSETCHPSDNLSAVLAATEYANRAENQVAKLRQDSMRQSLESCEVVELQPFECGDRVPLEISRRHDIL